MTSTLSRCSAASPDIGFDTVVGLSFAETQVATALSGASRCAFAYMAHSSWLCKCSRVTSIAMKGSVKRESSSWLRKPGKIVSSASNQSGSF